MTLTTSQGNKIKIESPNPKETYRSMKHIKNKNDKALELRVNFGDNAIKVCHEVIEQLKCIYGVFDENEMTSSQNYILGRINEWQEVKSLLETFPKIEKDDSRKISSP